MTPQTPRRQDDAGEPAEEQAAAFRPAEAAKKREALLREQIDQNLQRAYRETLEEPVPERFLALIAELRGKLNKP